MLTRIIEGRYNTTNYEKDKCSKTRYRSIYVFRDEEKNLVKFEGNYFSEIESAVQDAIRYLHVHNLTKDYTLFFNNAKISVNADSNADLIISNYLKNYRNSLYAENDVNA